MGTMLKTILPVGYFVFGITIQSQATIIADWTFETSQPSGTAATIGPFNAEAGVNAGSTSQASGVHASSSSVWSSPVGAGSAHSFSSEHWGTGDYYQFASSAVGYNNIAVSFEATGSSTGPRDFKLAYSTDGSLFTDFGSYSVLVNGAPNTTWGAGMTLSQAGAYGFSFNLSGVPSLNNASTVFFRLIDTSLTTGGAINGGNVGTAGTSRVDDFTISGTAISAVPEPSTLVTGLGLSLGMLFSFVRKIRK